MTALIGVVEDGIGYLAVDRQQTLGNSATTNCKIVRHPSYKGIAFAAAGAPLIAYPATLIDVPDVDDDGRIQPPGAAWADRYWKQLLQLGHPPLDRDGDLDGNLLVLTPGAITLIGATGWPSPIADTGVSLGTAGDFALGAYHGARHGSPSLSVEDALHHAILVACQLSHSASPPVDVLAL